MVSTSDFAPPKAYRTGKPWGTGRAQYWKTPEQRFWEKVDKRGPDECWPWLGHLSKMPDGSPGYGSICVNSKHVRATKFSYELHIGPTNGFDLLHKCDNPPCVNPNHLFIGTAKDNALDASRKGRMRNQFKDKTHCKHGHEFTPENTYYYPHAGGTGVGRGCKECRRQQLRESRQRRKKGQNQ